MTEAPSQQQVQARWGPDPDVTASWLLSVAEHRGPLTIASIGPRGTSAHHALLRLQRRQRDASPAEGALRPVLHPDFGSVLGDLLEGTADYALVPSAYRDATAFHWHPEVVLAGLFVHATPEYGLASRCGPTVLDQDAVVVAAMSEVADLWTQLLLERRDGPRVHRVPAASTSDAAQMVRAGRADIAVCNDLGRRENALHWVEKRSGVDMVWMLFEKR